MKYTIRKIPKDTELTHFFLSRGKIFGMTKLDKGHYMLKIVHCWEDGEPMNFKYVEDGVVKKATETSPNRLHVVKIFKEYPTRNTIQRNIVKFLKDYDKGYNQTQGGVS